MHQVLFQQLRVMGGAGFYGDGGPATAAGLDHPYSVVPFGGEVYIVNDNQGRVRKISVSGIISTVIGNGSGTASGDGGPATAAGVPPYNIAFDKNANIYIVSGYLVRKVDALGIVSTIAGPGGTALALGEGGQATAASINAVGICVDPTGSIYIADRWSNRIRKIRNHIPFLHMVQWLRLRSATMFGARRLLIRYSRLLTAIPCKGLNGAYLPHPCTDPLI